MISRIDDIALVTRVTMFHDQKAFARLVDKYQSSLRSFFLSQTLGDKALSDDLAQETFVKVWTYLSGFEGRAQFKTWLFRIAYNVLYDYRRKQHEQQDLETPQVQHATGSNSDVGLQVDLRHALAILSDTERTCVTLQLVDGQSIESISDIMKMPQNTVKSHLRRGKMALQEYLKNNGY